MANSMIYQIAAFAWLVFGVYVGGGTIRGNNVVYTFISIEKLNR